MILVLSYKGFEQCTDPVIDWLLHYKRDFLKLSINDIYNDKKVKFDIHNDKVYVNGVDIIEKVNCIYFRRFEAACPVKLKNCFPTDQAEYEVTNEMNALINYFFHLLKDKHWLPNPQSSSIDKLSALSIAKSVGLSIPKSTVVNNRKDLENFLSLNRNVIIKPINFCGYYIEKDFSYFGFTRSFKDEDLKQVEQSRFAPTLFQEKVDKDFEIRTFYLEGKLYPSAIIVDEGYKNHDDIKTVFNTKQIHWLPYQFPKDIENKIIMFMDKCGLNTGSIDIIKNKNDDFVFIEVNPVGQFIAPSRRCNYYVERLIAKWLIENDKR